jgi:hypothetical protein
MKPPRINLDVGYNLPTHLVQVLLRHAVALEVAPHGDLGAKLVLLFVLGELPGGVAVLERVPHALGGEELEGEVEVPPAAGPLRGLAVHVRRVVDEALALDTAAAASAAGGSGGATGGARVFRIGFLGVAVQVAFEAANFETRFSSLHRLEG